MAVYQIFPKKDATLYSEYPQLNSGLDEILELTKTSTSDPARILISFDQQQLILYVIELSKVLHSTLSRI